MVDSENCAIWQELAEIEPTTGDYRIVKSSRAGGTYKIFRSAETTIKKLATPEKIKLTTWLISQRRLGHTSPVIDSSTVDQIEKQKQLSVHDRANELLRYIDGKSQLLGTVIQFYSLDNTKSKKVANELLAYTASQEISEVITLAEYCAKEGWIEHRASSECSRRII